MRAISDEQFTSWARGLQNSDRTDYAELFEATYDGLFGFARYIVREPSAAHDVLQDVYMKLWTIREDVDPSRSLKALMYQMVRNYALNHERQKKTRAAQSIDDSLREPAVPSTIERDVEVEALGRHIERWIADLPNRRREAFVLSRYEGLSHEEIARMMNLTPRTVNNHIVLALQDLRARLENYHSETIQP
ncbi:MAG: RNA polymerase sigma-70 factor [Rhodothermales bacterium]